MPRPRHPPRPHWSPAPAGSPAGTIWLHNWIRRANRCGPVGRRCKIKRRITMPLNEGDKLPALTLTDAAGGAINLATFRGGPLVLYFYPKADTPGCTREAQDFSALADDFAKAGAAVIGVSR